MDSSVMLNSSGMMDGDNTVNTQNNMMLQTPDMNANMNDNQLGGMSNQMGGMNNQLGLNSNQLGMTMGTQIGMGDMNQMGSQMNNNQMGNMQNNMGMNNMNQMGMDGSNNFMQNLDGTGSMQNLDGTQINQFDEHGNLVPMGNINELVRRTWKSCTHNW
jgi:hypothetical protein